MYSEIIKEFFSNASVEGDHINCWVRHKEFVITRESIQEFLEVHPPLQPITVQYNDRLDSIEEMVTTLGGTLKRSSMNTIPFNPETRTLAYVMIHNLYPVTNLMTLSSPRTIFMYDLFTHKEIDICGHIFHLLKKSIEKKELQNNYAVSLTDYRPNCKDKAQTLEWSHSGLKGLSYWCTHSD